MTEICTFSLLLWSSICFACNFLGIFMRHFQRIWNQHEILQGMPTIKMIIWRLRHTCFLLAWKLYQTWLLLGQYILYLFFKFLIPYSFGILWDVVPPERLFWPAWLTILNFPFIPWPCYTVTSADVFIHSFDPAGMGIMEAWRGCGMIPLASPVTSGRINTSTNTSPCTLARCRVNHPGREGYLQYQHQSMYPCKMQGQPPR